MLEDKGPINKEIIRLLLDEEREHINLLLNGRQIFSALGHQNLQILELIPKTKLERLEALLDKLSPPIHITNPRGYKLCCERTTSNSRSLLIRNNGLFISSDAQFFSAEATVYLDEKTRREEELELAVVKEIAREYANRSPMDSSMPPSTFRVFSSLEEARKYVLGCISKAFKRRRIGLDGIEYQAMICEGFESSEPFIFPLGITNTDNMLVDEDEFPTPKIIKTYFTGEVLVEDQDMGYYFPLQNNENPLEGGIHSEEIVFCESCKGSIEDRIKEDVIRRIKENPYRYDYCSNTAKKIGYVFDPNRLKVQISEPRILF